MGRLIAVPDRGNDRVAARADAFARFQGGRANQQLADQIGRAWAAGLLDGQTCDAAILRDIGRRYGGLYWHRFAAMAPRTGQLERRDRAAANDAGWDDRAGEHFERLDAAAATAGRAAVQAMQALCVDGWWFPDTDAPWLARLIGGASRSREGQASGALADDQARMDAAIGALLAMVDGRGARQP